MLPSLVPCPGGVRSPDLADAFLLTFACNDKRKIERYRRPVRNHSAWVA